MVDNLVKFTIEGRGLSIVIQQLYLYIFYLHHQVCKLHKIGDSCYLNIPTFYLASIFLVQRVMLQWSTSHHNIICPAFNPPD